LLAAVFEAFPFGVYVADVRTYDIVFMNRVLRDGIGVAPVRPCWETVYGQDRPCLECRIPMLLDAAGMPTGATSISERFNERDDRWYQMYETCVVWSDGRVVKTAIAVDVSDLKEAQNALAEAHAELALRAREIEHISATDHLTGIGNRRQLDHALQRELGHAGRAGQGFGLILCDLDHFKTLNDTHGHQMGDRVLVAAADLLRARLRRDDTLGRWGGEEFLIILPGVDADGVVAVAEKLRGGLADHDFAPVGRCTASFGATIWRVADTAESILRRADSAVYRAKEAGRNRVVGEFGSDGRHIDRGVLEG
jgi:diguanylate cyclase (GGDEF)-like protein